MQRIFIIVLDSLGIGFSDDAQNFGDYGSNTLGHIAEYCRYRKNTLGNSNLLNIPNLTRLGLGAAVKESTGNYLLGIDKQIKIIGAYAYASEISLGKDTQSGHWEITGVPMLSNWGYFPNLQNSFPSILLDELITHDNLLGYLGNCHASGTKILDELGEIHIRTGKPIFYTSIDSVFQIACHEEVFGLYRLYHLCKTTRTILTNNGYNIGRVIARPFTGFTMGQFKRTNNRMDFSLPPPSTTVLQKLIEEKQGTVVSIGKIADIFAQTGISKKIKANGLNALFNATIKEINMAKNNTLIFTNFVDFDSLYGHRRDIFGYANELELFDQRLPELMTLVKDNDILILTADHGCDPTWHGTNHTRENIPILMYGPKINSGFYGHRLTFADIGQTIAHYFNLTPMKYGTVIL